jgi:transposase
MARSTQLADLFRSPALVAQRHYEICKAYYLDAASAEQLAERFRLHPDSIRAIVRDFAHDPDLEQFFVVHRPGRQTAPKRDALLEDILRLRQQGLTLAQIEQRLREQGHSISESYLSRLLARQGLADLQASRCQQSEGVRAANDGSEIPAAADARLCSFEPGRRVPSKVAGLFLFVPLLLAVDLPAAVERARWPGSCAVPATSATCVTMKGPGCSAA